MTFNNLFFSFEKVLNTFFSHKYWLWRLVGLTIFITFFLYVGLNITPFLGRYKGFYLIALKDYSPDFLEKNGFMSSYWNFMKEQAAQPFKQHHDLHPVDHKSNMAYRLMLPMVFKITHFGVLGVFFLQLVLGIVQLFITAKIAYHFLADKVSTFYFTLAIAGIYFGNAFYYDVRGYGDPWVFAFMTLAIFYRNPILIFIFTQLVFWTDERGLISITFVGLWWLMEQQESFDFKKAIKNTRVLSIIASVAFYFIVRFTLESIYHLGLPSRAISGGEETGGAGLWVFLRYTSGWLGSSFWSGYEAFLLLIIVGFTLLYKLKQYAYFNLLLLSVLVSLATTFMVYDTMRSISYTGILLFIFLRLTSQHIEQKELRYFLLVLAAINIFAPSFY